jgi:hypothetical protein
VDALALRRSYIIVGSNEADADTPIVTPESPLQVYAERDPRTREVVAAVKRWEDPAPPGGSPVKRASLYLPQTTVQFELSKGTWTMLDQDEHKLGQVLVTPLVNRPRLQYPDGTSELRAVIPLSDAACKIATDMMVSAEYHSMPRRWATGVSKDDFADANGQPLGAMSTLAGRIWSNESTDVKYGQFPEASLTNFHETINALARLVSALTGLPPSFLGLATDQPPSADAIRATEARLVKRAERRQRALGGPWERVMRQTMLVRDGEVDPRAMSLETVWRDPATPTFAQMADATVKLYSVGLLPKEAAWEKLGFSAVQISRMQGMDDAALTRMTAADMHAISTAPPVAGPADPGTVPQWQASSADG